MNAVTNSSVVFGGFGSGISMLPECNLARFSGCYLFRNIPLQKIKGARHSLPLF